MKPIPYDFRPQDIRSLKLFKQIRKLLRKLHKLHPHPNRKLHYDEYICLLLLYYFNPILTSLRSVQHAAGFPNVQKRLGVHAASLGSLSEASHVFDPEPLRLLFLEAADQARASTSSPAVPRPRGLPHDLRLLAVDGTLWSRLPRMAQYFWLDGPRPGRPPGFKAHVLFDIENGLPADVRGTDGYDSERRVLAECIKPHTLYIVDAGYIDYTLFQKITDKESSFLIRARSDTVATVLESRPISPEARQAGVYADEIVAVGSAPHAHKITRPLRRLRVRVRLDPPHNLNPRRASDTYDPQHRYDAHEMELVLLTDLLDVPAEDLVLCYRYRWQIEIFFRWLKYAIGCKHLIAESDNGLCLMVYAALIASLLITIWTGKRPNKRLLETIQLYFSGWITADDVADYIERLPPPKS
jgi:hypothetical protein